MLISDKTDFKSKLVRRDKDHYLVEKGATHQEDVTIINLYAPNIGTFNFMRQTLLGT
jgi:hypothetical protein